MRKTLYPLILFYLLSFSLKAQESIIVEKTKLSISTLDKEQIRIQLLFELKDGYEHVDGAISRNNPDNLSPTFILKSKKELSITKLEANSLSANRKGVGFSVDVDEKTIESIVSGEYDYYFEMPKDLFVVIRNTSNPADTTRFKLTTAQVIDNTKNNLTVSDSQKSELVESIKGNVTRMGNTLDFGVIPAGESDTDNTEYTASFSYQNGYSYFKDSPIFFSAKGLIGTNSNDSLNYLSVYPVSYKISQYDKSGKPRNYDLVAQLGVDGNQTLSNYRISGNIYWQGLIPNLVDLTMGENRLRLKPVFKIGAKYYREFENKRIVETENEDGNQFFAELYYYIPIKKLYSLTIDANAFYDFNDTFNPDQKIMHNVSITFGIEIPETGFKTIFKYIEGENGITYQQDELLMIGFMADLFSK